ncbi:Nicotinate-nucleotide adenylyltransferase [Acaryochloris thomasi RCC1774]|uniref:Probable nicotinate-nucleotide adenylyltransferase n=1 Tax=Acaryochloris thomasi RCC1774 TaxID=1764569 RepID=A0A2W1JU77_9CYAN|nr:Nicotinate-nucleotide adenylyltransferase [Acaryochloris thomasi RCC1774]
MNIALFGTSADPPTIGHQVVLEWLVQRFDLVAVWASDNPFKGNQTPLEHRQQMLRRLVDQVQVPQIQHDPNLSDPRTLNTVNTARLRWPAAQFTLVVGSDVLPTLLHWHRVAELLRLVKILVVPRSGAPLMEATLQALRSQQAEVAIADFLGPDISSSAYRNTGNSAGLPETISTYIQEHDLYPKPTDSLELPSDLPLAGFNVGVDNVIFSVDTNHNQLLVLLAVRQTPPYVGQWALPGTLVRQGEALENAAYRILSEKIRVQNLYLEQLYTFGGPNRDPRESAESSRYLSVSYFAVVRYEEAILMSDERHLISWHPIGQIPPLAFDHAQILAYGHNRLRNKLEYSPVAFDVLPDLFTLSDLYQLYRTVLGDQFSDYSNFRARILKLGFLAATGQKVGRGAGRPASLYRFDAEAFAPLKDKPMVFI